MPAPLVKGTVAMSGMVGVAKALKNREKKYFKALSDGIKLAGLFVQRESMLIVPVDTGHLKGSADTKHTGEGLSTVVSVSYSAIYAVFVHENLDASHQPGKESKFLESVIRDKREEIIGIVFKTAERAIKQGNLKV